MILKLLVLTICILLSINVSTVSANEKIRFLKISLNDGSSVLYAVNNDLTWGLNDNTLNIHHSLVSESEKYLVDDVKSISYILDIPTEIASNEDDNLKIHLSKNGFSISTVGGGDLKIFSLSGILVIDKYVNGNTFIDISSLPMGIYIAKFNERPILKYIRK